MTANQKRLIIAVAWVAVVGGWILYQRSTGLGPVGTLQSLIDHTRGARWAFAAFLIVYALRPIVLFPASLMTIAGGLLFGPVGGIAATVLGANASAMVAYWLARSLGFGNSHEDKNNHFDLSTEASSSSNVGTVRARWAERMRNESFVTVMLMRLAFLPYDLVNYTAGLLRIRPVPFLLATAIGSLPGTVSFTLAGASIDSLEDGPSGVDTRVLAASVALFIASVAISRIVKRRERLNVATEKREHTLAELA